jgi:hypothetical protein
MKYIKSYNESSEKSYNKLCDDLSDICLELTDIGFKITFNSYGDDCPGSKLRTQPGLSISIFKSYFKLSEIKETILRIVHYMKIEGYNSTWDNKALKKIDYKISGITLEFQKKKKNILSNFLKYLKKEAKNQQYSNEVTLSEDMKQDIRDILLELSDKGYEITNPHRQPTSF